ncbi:type 1 fimbrial protein [Pseudomonas parafulva]|uniref:Type 1 fimbrial protein n=1 Tax=Pseudomonas parafulva TaxID=157782 RepID=A0AAI8PDP0_9PSED|nr:MULTISPECIES: fimbrial protein [Pseudomonas]AIZ34973.1 fimbrial protein [Pseudomonas parafulva]ATB65500.1 type 1 fimbrial protein [Pseudomonas mosselii]AXO90722.1 type 1 fimbrial protein [Pseudomonas parafulva]
MHKSLSLLTLSFGLLASAVSFADSGQIVFTGSVTDNACTINTNDMTKSVTLDPVRIADFANQVGAKAKPKTFSLTLENCSLATRNNVQIKFSGQPDQVDNTLLGLTGDNQVKGIAIQIDDARTGNKVPLNVATEDYEMRPQSNTFDFVASYVRTTLDVTTGDSPNQVTTSGIGTGKVNALATFDVTYR